MYSVRGEINQISTNTLRYTMCSAPNVYMFVYTLIGAPYCTFKTLTLIDTNAFELLVRLHYAEMNIGEIKIKIDE